MNTTKKNTTPEISKLLTISIAHVTAETRALLQVIADDRFSHQDVPVVVYAKGIYGFLIFTELPEEFDRKGVPDDLCRCVDYARTYDCDFLVLDVDGPEMENLEVF